MQLSLLKLLLVEPNYILKYDSENKLQRCVSFGVPYEGDLDLEMRISFMSGTKFSLLLLLLLLS